MTFRSRNLRIFRLHTISAALILGVTALLLAGCGETKDKPGEKQGAAPQMPASPTIATVGNDEIKAYELANEMRLAGVPMGKDKEKPDEQVTKRFMRELVQRKYLVQKAIAEKLDRDPSFLVEQQRQREQLLANLYLQRAVADTSLSGSRIEAYQANHPLMFAKRQALEIEQVIFPLTQASKPILEAAKGFKTLEEVAQLLKGRGVSFNRGEGEIGSGDMPPEVFEMMQKKSADNVFFTARGPNGVFFVVKEIKPQPLTGEAATQLAKRMLLNEVAREKATEKLPADLAVHYEGDLERIMNLPDAPPKAPPPQEPAGAGQAAAPAEAPASKAAETAPSKAPAPAAAETATSKPAAEAGKGKPAQKK
jgi:EpsD family peptidyl-prolyl cis-trans isomerase